MPHQSEALFVGEQVFQNGGGCWQHSLPCPTTPCFVNFLLSLQFMHGHFNLFMHSQNVEKLFVRECLLHRPQ